MKFKITLNTTFSFFEKNAEYGIFFYDKKIETIHDIGTHIGIRSYRIKLILVEDREYVSDEPYMYEVIDFIATFDLDKYTETKSYDETIKVINYDNIVGEFMDKTKLNFLKKRLEKRIINKTIPIQKITT